MESSVANMTGTTDTISSLKYRTAKWGQTEEHQSPVRDHAQNAFDLLCDCCGLPVREHGNLGSVVPNQFRGVDDEERGDNGTAAHQGKEDCVDGGGDSITCGRVCRKSKANCTTYCSSYESLEKNAKDDGSSNYLCL